MADRRRRLASARLYLCLGCDDVFVAQAALRGGVDMIQLRDKSASDAALAEAGARLRDLCRAAGALLWVNDRPDLALAVGADGVHVGQQDLPVAEARAQVGPELLVGLSTHSSAQLAAARDSEADQLSVGPVWATPTKEGRAAAGLGYVRHAAATVTDRPWFAIGGIDSGNLDEVLAAGARRVAVVRAIRDAPDPEAAARSLRDRLDATPDAASC